MSQTLVMDFPEAPEGEVSQVASGSVTVDAEGFLDLRGRRGRLTVSTKGEGLAGADALAGDMEMILDGRAMYMNSPFYQQLAPDHEPWLRVTFEELGLRGMSQLGQQDPLAFVEALRGVRGKVEEIGTEEVRGESTTHYRATIDIPALTADLPPAARRTVETSFAQLGIEQMPVDAWLDAQGRLRRLVSSVGLQGETVAGGEMNISLDLYDFGVAFELKVPPADQVANFAEVFGETGD
jgi:hypothetical protein